MEHPGGVHQLVDDLHAPVGEVEVLALKANEFAPAHPGVDGKVDHDWKRSSCASASMMDCSHVRSVISVFGTFGGCTRSHGLARIFCFSTATWNIRRIVR